MDIISNAYTDLNIAKKCKVNSLLQVDLAQTESALSCKDEDKLRKLFDKTE